jgi:hypothetical protein
MACVTLGDGGVNCHILSHKIEGYHQGNLVVTLINIHCSNAMAMFGYRVF